MEKVFLFFSLLIILSACSSSPENHPSGEEETMDTSQYIPQGAPSVSAPHSSRVDTVFISEMKFQPEEINITKGDTVIWINNDLVEHCVTEAHNMNWTSHKIAAGSSWKKKIEQDTDYYCAIHLVMKGRIVVTPTL